MTTPLSLRLCCLATMAPALTDPAAKSLNKLSTKLRPPEISPNLEDKKEYSLSNLTWNKLLEESQDFKELNPKEQGILRRAISKSFGQSIKPNLIQHQNIDSLLKKKSLEQGKLSALIQKENISKDCMKMNQPSSGLNGYQENGKAEEQGDLSNVSAKLASLRECNNSTSETQVEDFQSSEKKQNSESDMVASDHNIETVDVIGSTDMTMEREEEMQVPKSEEELSADVNQKQISLIRRNQHLMRRLRRLQARQLEMHCRNQVASFVSFQRRNLQTVANRSIGSQNISGQQSELKAELLKSEDVKNLSTSALVNLVRKIQASSMMNRRLQVKSRDAEKELHHQPSVLNMDAEVSSESARVAGHLSTNMHHMQNAFDSDATESSSGGESCDEYDDYEQERKVPPPSLHRRAEWKWSADRAGVASRWTWLQAQVSDLEYRIRQQSEIFKQIRHAKGSVVLGDPPSLEEIGARLRQARASGQKLSPFETKIADIDLKADNNGSPCNISTLLLNVNQQATKLTQSLGNCLTPEQSMSGDKFKSNGAKILNGVISGHSAQECAMSGPSTSSSSVGPSGDNSHVTPELPPSFPFLDATCMAARSRPVRSYRKRKLLRTAGLHQVSRKAARLSTVKCQCNPPFSACPMCGGRYNNTQTLEPGVMSLSEKVALLDPAYHPVLSFKEEIPLPIHFESLLKSGEWQNKPPPKSAKALAAEKRRQKLLSNSMKERVRKNPKYGKRTANALIASAKLRNKYERTPPKSFSLKSPKKKVSDGTLCRADLKRRRDSNKYGIASLRHSADDNLCLSLNDSLTSGSRTPTPSPQMKDGMFSSSCPSSTLKELRRRREDAYDIDNIVEDVTEEAYLERHKICEASERKRFTSFIQYPSRRSRGSRNEAGPSTPESSADTKSLKEREDVQSVAQTPEEIARKRSSTLSSTSSQTFNVASPLSDDAFRRRSSSTSVRRISTNSFLEDNSDFSFDLVGQEVVDPWPDRQFPLSEEEYEGMKQEMPVIEIKENNSVRRRQVQTKFTVVDDIENNLVEDRVYMSSRVSSPVPSVSSGSNASDDDPDDPEWTASREENSRNLLKSRR
ncbi:hypothetical protein FSP39_021317 [Pinctada imbricata]|uniref:PEHE domain-containing protein n=1 Tax=Pinctada imbricata TaxID=66713 RepID=A0AA88YS26_PINIB|nr:hypothetical protein FSP39_021317 [Pinctada imbricata]